MDARGVTRLVWADLEGMLHRFSILRREPTTPDQQGELESLGFRVERLSQRLRLLDEAGLLTLGTRTARIPGSILRDALGEVQDECERRGIRIVMELAASAAPVWLDEGQLLEAMRCALDIALAAVGRGGSIMACAREVEGSLQMSVAYDGGHEEDAPAGAELTILRRITTGMSACLRIEGERGLTCISITLPFEPAACEYHALVTDRIIPAL